MTKALPVYEVAPALWKPHVHVYRLQAHELKKQVMVEASFDLEQNYTLKPLEQSNMSMVVFLSWAATIATVGFFFSGM